MEIKDLKVLLRTLRQNGVLSYKTPEIELTLSSEFMIQKPGAPIEQEVDFPSGELTPEQLLFYSAGGSPADDPENLQ